MQSASDLDNEDCLIDEAKELHGKLEEVLKDTKMKITGILKTFESTEHGKLALGMREESSQIGKENGLKIFKLSVRLIHEV